MCDYSLQGLPNRLAVEGEEVVTHRFPSGSLGMASPLDIAVQNRPQPRIGRENGGRRRAGCRRRRMPCQTAACIPPGTRLLMARI
jgi:hypothetical protein